MDVATLPESICSFKESLKEQLVQASQGSKDPYLEARIKFLTHQVRGYCNNDLPFTMNYAVLQNRKEKDKLTKEVKSLAS